MIAYKEVIVILRRIVIGFSLLLTLPLGAVDVGTSISDVSHEGPHERVGSVSMTLTNDDFGNASPDNPIYIRFSLGAFNSFAETVVDPRTGAHPSVASPINLAISSSSNLLNVNGIPADAVQLVRLVAGERFGWIRITDSSSDWFELEPGVFSPPATDLSASFTFGIIGSLSVAGIANTPSGGNERADTNQLASTVMYADYFDTPNFRRGDTDSIFLISFDLTTSGVDGDGPVIPGNQTQITFSNDLTVARGVGIFPCIEFHNIEGDYARDAHQVDISRLNLVSIRRYKADIPPFYLTNSSDFDWESGSRLFVHYQDYNPDYLVDDEKPPVWYDPQVPSTYFEETPLDLISSNGSQWDVTPVYHNNQFMGWELRLRSGVWPVDGFLLISGLVLRSDDFYAENPLKASATGYFRAQGITNELLRVGPLQRNLVEMTTVPDPFINVIPYTAYDRDDWNFTFQMANPHNETLRYTALFFNPNSLLLNMLGSYELAPNASTSFSVQDAFGEAQVPKLSWIYVIADKPFASVGVIQDKGRQSLDIINSVDGLRQEMWVPHVPQDIASWTTNAYVISANPDVDTDFFINLPGEAPERLRVFFPAASARLNDGDFIGATGRSPWFSVSAGQPVGAGIFFYSQPDTNRVLASVPMDAQATRRWRFGHVGNTEAGWWNGLAVLNTRDFTNGVDIIAYDSAGVELTRARHEIAANTREVDLLDSFLDYNGPIDRLEVVGDENLVCLLLMGRVGELIQTTIPGNLAQREDLILPYLPNQDGDWGGIALINNDIDDVQVSVIPYTAAGEAGPETLVNITQEGKRLFVMETLVPNDGKNYTHLRASADGLISGYLLTGDGDFNQLGSVAFRGIDFLAEKR